MATLLYDTLNMSGSEGLVPTFLVGIVTGKQIGRAHV